MTRVATHGRGVRRLQIGHTLPRGATLGRVTLDGDRVRARSRLTNRGLEVAVTTRPGTHRLVVRTR